MSVLKATNAIRFSSVFLKPLIEHGSSDQLMSCISLCLSEKEAKATGLSKGLILKLMALAKASSLHGVKLSLTHLVCFSGNQNVAGFLISAMFSFIGNLDVK